MIKWMKGSLSLLLGAIYGALCMIFSRLMILKSGALLLFIGKAAGLPEKTVRTLFQVLEQLEGAHLISPWAWAVTVFALRGSACILWTEKSRKRKIAAGIFAVALLLPASFLCAAATRVNGIYLWHMLKNLLPLIDALL